MKITEGNVSIKPELVDVEKPKEFETTSKIKVQIKEPEAKADEIAI